MARTRDRANCFKRQFRGFTIVKMPWEQSVAVFSSGVCVETFQNYNAARSWVLGLDTSKEH